MVKKILGIVVLGLFLTSNAHSESINSRLTKIEERLTNIEESLAGLKMLENLFNSENLNEKNSAVSTGNKSKLSFKLNLLSCTKDMFDKINIGYTITNNYNKEVKLVDAVIETTDLFGELVFKGKIAKDVYLKAGESDTVKGSFDDILSDQCSKIKQARLNDLKSDLNVSKIAFGDNSIVEF